MQQMRTVPVGALQLGTVKLRGKLSPTHLWQAEFLGGPSLPSVALHIADRLQSDSRTAKAATKGHPHGSIHSRQLAELPHRRGPDSYSIAKCESGSRLGSTARFDQP